MDKFLKGKVGEWVKGGWMGELVGGCVLGGVWVGKKMEENEI